MPQLRTDAPLPSYLNSVVSLFSINNQGGSKKETIRQLILRSVRLHLYRSKSRREDEEQLDGFREGVLPLRVRPAFVVFNTVALIILALLGFHPKSSHLVAPINDKILHFICFFLATGLFYFIWDVDEPARRIWIWRHMALILTWIICFVAGGIGSEFVQSILPYKEFQWGDVFANLLGSALGLFVSFHAEKRHRLRREIARLYEPLDQELYGDEEEEEELNAWDDDGGDANDPWRNVRPTTRKLSVSSTTKKVRFNGTQIEENNVAETHQETASSSQDGFSNRTSPIPTKDTLFSIEDDEDEDEAAEAWKAAK